MGIELCVKMRNQRNETIPTKSAWKNLESALNDAASKSRVGRYFKLEARKTCLTRELRAGLATFLTMAYIITVNATIISDSGGPCATSPPDEEYQACVSRVKSDLVVATILSAMIGSFAMGLFANLPLGLAPAMGPNAYVAYNLVGFHGSGPISYQTALAIVLVEACVFFAISVLGLRAKLARIFPTQIRLACAAGIGLFIAFVGLQAHQGMGLVGPDVSTLVTATACSETDPVTGECLAGKMQNPKFWLGVLGFVITSYGLTRKFKGSMIYGILFVTAVSWFRDTPVTYFPNDKLGDSDFAYFKRIVDFPAIRSTAGAISFENFNTGEVWLALATLLYVDVLATTGILYTMAEIGELVDDRGKFEGEYSAYIVDSASSAVGSALGVSTTATYVESAAGLREGGRTGLTAVTIGACFALSLFFTPILASVPPWAVGPSLVMVGAMMMGVVREIDWDDARSAIPAFVTIALMPLTYSISNGIIGGIGIHVALRMFDWIAGFAKWTVKMRRRVVKEHNQVDVDPTLEII